MKLLEPRTDAPDFTSITDEMQNFRLSEYFGHRHIVLFFYFRDFTPRCTKEMKCIRDHLTEFEALGAKPIGISRDASLRHGHFKEKHGLNFTLLTDLSGEISFAYHATGRWFLTRKRVTYVISKEGKIVQGFKDLGSGEAHVQNALEALKDLNR